MSEEKGTEKPQAEVKDPPVSEKPKPNESRSPNEEDYKALATINKKNYDEAQQRLAVQEARIRQLEAVALRPPTDPRAEAIRSMQERAALGDPDAAAFVEVGRIAANAQIKADVMDAMAKGQVSAQDWDEVKELILNSVARGAPMSVEEAKKRARGVRVDEVEADRSKLREENERLKKELDAEKTRVRIPNMAARPAAVPHDAQTISAADMRSILAKGGEEARQLKARINAPRGSETHLEVDYRQ